MKVSDVTVEVRNANFQRVGQFVPADLVGFTAVLRYNAIGTWKMSLPVSNELAAYLVQPGAGIVVTTTTGVLLSGPTTSVSLNQSSDDVEGTYEIAGVDDSVLLAERLAYPTPSTADVTAQSSAYDTRTGAAETVMKGFVEANLGSSAPLVRQIANFTVETDLARGGSVTISARFEKLQELLKGIADVTGLGFTIEQFGNGLQFQVYQPADKTTSVRLDISNNLLSKIEYAYSQPKATRVIVGGSGDGAARIFLERATTTSTSSEAEWGRRIEVFADQRSTSSALELQQAGDEVLATDGETIVSISIMPTDEITMLYGVDWNLGDKITCVVGTLELQSIVTEVALSIAADGVRIGATVGEPNTLDYETQIVTRQANQAARISNLERK